MITQNATAFVIPLPMSYAQRLKSVPHVTEVTWANWFGGKYGDGKDFFAQFAIDPESYLKMYPEFVIPEEQKQAFFKERSAALVGEGLIKKFGWKLGQNVTIQGTIFPGDWTFTIRGIYHPSLKEYEDGNRKGVRRRIRQHVRQREAAHEHDRPGRRVRDPARGGQRDDDESARADG